MRMLQHRPGVSWVPPVRSGLSVVWGSVHPMSRAVGFGAWGAQGPAPEGAGGLDAIRACGGRLESLGQTRRLLRANWPGRGFGVRAPEVDETPLSAAEVPYMFATFEARA